MSRSLYARDETKFTNYGYYDPMLVKTIAIQCNFDFFNFLLILNISICLIPASQIARCKKLEFNFFFFLIKYVRKKKRGETIFFC